jgi:hypothetical protein
MPQVASAYVLVDYIIYIVRSRTYVSRLEAGSAM